jgi:hypothetical protein
MPKSKGALVGEFQLENEEPGESGRGEEESERLAKARFCDKVVT